MKFLIFLLVLVGLIIVYICYINGFFGPKQDVEIKESIDYVKCEKKFDGEFLLWYKGNIVYSKYIYDARSMDIINSFISNCEKEAEVIKNNIKNCDK